MLGPLGESFADCGLKEEEFVTREFFQNLVRFPLFCSFVHVVVAYKETDDAIWDSFAEINQHSAIVSDNSVLMPQLNLCADLQTDLLHCKTESCRTGI